MATSECVVFFNANHIGHFIPTLELVRLLVQKGLKVHYFCDAVHKQSIEATGALYHHYGDERWNLRNSSIQQSKAFGCEPTEGMKNDLLFEQSLPASIQILPYIIEQLKILKPLFCVSDSGYPWGFIAADLLNILMISSCSSLPIHSSDRRDIFYELNNLPVMQSCMHWLKETYNYNYQAHDSYCNYTEYTIIWCIPQYIPDFIEDKTIHYYGISMPMEKLIRNKKLSVLHIKPTCNENDVNISSIEDSNVNQNNEKASSLSVVTNLPSLRAHLSSLQLDASNSDTCTTTTTTTSTTTTISTTPSTLSKSTTTLSTDALISSILQWKLHDNQLIIYISLGSVVGTESWTPDPLPYYEALIELFTPQKEYTIGIRKSMQSVSSNSSSSNSSSSSSSNNNSNSNSNISTKLRGNTLDDNDNDNNIEYVTKTCHIILSTGKIFDLNTISSKLPPNFYVTTWIDQTAILPYVDIFITHCGMNSTTESLFDGIPMICTPIFGDQNLNGDRVMSHNCGVLIKSPYRPAPCTSLTHLNTITIDKAMNTLTSKYYYYKESCEYMQQCMYDYLYYLHTDAVDDILKWVHTQRSSNEVKNSIL